MIEKFYDLRDELDNVKRNADLVLYELSETDNEAAYQHMTEAFALLQKATEELRNARLALNS
jgi:hypothetical protein